MLWNPSEGEAAVDRERTAEVEVERKFWAFISYSHRDEEHAVRIHRALEAYRIPRQLAGRSVRDTVVPQRLFPVFRDRDELASGPDLTDQVRRALERSRALVVICSPAAAKSRYVSQEIAHFQGLGRADRIFTVIAGGEPSSDPESELDCFPPELRSKVNTDHGLEFVAPIASDVRPKKDTRRAALLKLVAGILGVGLDELRRRDDQRRTAARINATAFAAVGALALALIFFVSSDAGLTFPGSERARTWLDAAGLTLFRRVAPRSEVQRLAARARRRLEQALLQRQLPDGTFTYRAVRPESDTWSSAEAIAALVSAPELDRAQWARVQTTLDELFQHYLVRDTKGLTGWLCETGRPPNGAISLWLVSALARALRRHDLPDSDRRTVAARFETAIAAASRLRPVPSGGWNMYPSMDDPNDHDAYSTVLALQALLDVRASGLQWTIDHISLAKLTDEAAAWLIRAWDTRDGAAGWTAFPAETRPSERNILDGLSLQIFDTLLRAEAEAGVMLPTELVRVMTSRLIEVGKRPPEYRKDQYDFALMVAGRWEKEGTYFTWFPWAARAALSWLERPAATTAPAAERRAVERTLGRIVATDGDAFLSQATATESETFEITELLFCFSAIDGQPQDRTRRLGAHPTSLPSTHE